MILSIIFFGVITLLVLFLVLNLAKTLVKGAIIAAIIIVVLYFSISFLSSTEMADNLRNSKDVITGLTTAIDSGKQVLEEKINKTENNSTDIER